MTVMLVPTLEIDLGVIAINSGDIYAFFMGMDIISGL